LGFQLSIGNCQLSIVNAFSPSHGPQPDAKASEIDPLARLRIVEVAALEADAQVDPQRRDLVGVIVAVLVGVAFDEPAIDAAFLAGAGDFFLPALEQTRHVEHRLLPQLGVGDLHAHLIVLLFEMNTGQLFHLVEEPMFEGRRPPGGPQIAGDAGGFELQP